MQRSIGMDLTKGPLLKKIILFSIPVILTNYLQLFFQTADTLVMGYFVGDNAVAAVGATGSISYGLIGLFSGLAIGSNVMVSRYIGNKDEEKVKELIGMSVFISVIVGLFIAIVGVLLARTFVTVTNVPEEIVDDSTLYMQIYFLGAPALLMYNYISAILRASGDSVRPLIILSIGGAINIGLNLFLVLCCDMTVDGVAIATVASEAFSAIAGLIVLLKNQGMAKFQFKYFKIFKKEIKSVLIIGIPAGIQASLFSVSNIVTQSAMNGFGTSAMAADSYAVKLEGVAGMAMNGIELGSLSVISQNYGVGDIERTKKSIIYSALLACTLGLTLSVICYFVAPYFFATITDNQEVIDIAMLRMLMVGLPYFIGGLLAVMCETVRALGKSILAMVISLFLECLLKVVWMLVVVNIWHYIYVVYLGYLATWVVEPMVYLPLVVKLLKDAKKKHAVNS